MEYSDIKEGQPLPPHTLMEMPEMSYAQELLAEPIPIENRIRFLSPYLIVYAERCTLKKISSELGISNKYALSIIDTMQIQIDDGEYPLCTKELVEDEIIWNDTIENMNEYLTAPEISRALDCSESWVREMANELAVFPVSEVSRGGAQWRQKYPKGLASMLRNLAFQTSHKGDWYELAKLAQEVHRPVEWVAGVLDSFGVRPINMAAASSGEDKPHYRSSAREIVIKYNELMPTAV